MSEMTASEALFGFAAWLTTRPTVTTLSSGHDATVAADLVAHFCEVNNLAEPRDDWTDRLTHPAS